MIRAGGLLAAFLSTMHNSTAHLFSEPLPAPKPKLEETRQMRRARERAEAKKLKRQAREVSEAMRVKKVKNPDILKGGV